MDVEFMTCTPAIWEKIHATAADVLFGEPDAAGVFYLHNYI